MSAMTALAALLVGTTTLVVRQAGVLASRSAATARLRRPGVDDRARQWPRLARMLDDAAIGVSPETFARSVAAAVAIGALVGLVVVGFGGALLGGLVPAVLAVGWLWLLRNRRDLAVQAELPDALDAVARSLRAGLSLPAALGATASSSGSAVAADLRRVVQRVEHGESLVDALAAWVGWRPVPAVTLVAAALSLAAEAGGAQARAVESVAVTVRDRLVAAGEARALSSQARASALLIAALPVGFLVLASAADPDSASVLLSTRFGFACLVAGVVLDAIALVWMHRLTDIEP